MSAYTGLLAARLRGESCDWPTWARADALLAAAAAHGVEALVDRACRRDDADPWPASVRERLGARARAAAASEPIHRREAASVVAALADAGVQPLVLKGAALAYTHYAVPWLRPREDLDLLVASSAAATADRVLRQLGYGLATGYDGDLVTHQRGYARTDRYAVTHLVDLHTKISNPHAFAHVLTYDELAPAAVPIAALGPSARGLAPPHALLLACVHRVAHHANADRLVWLHDIHLLVTGLSASERAAVAALGGAKSLRAVCASGLRMAHTRLATPVHADWLHAFDPAGGVEPTAAFLGGGRTKLSLLLSDLRTLRGWRSRGRLVWQHLFPPRAYIERAYTLRYPVLLPLAYLHRIVTGAPKWFRRRDPAGS